MSLYLIFTSATVHLLICVSYKIKRAYFLYLLLCMVYFANICYHILLYICYQILLYMLCFANICYHILPVIVICLTLAAALYLLLKKYGPVLVIFSIWYLCGLYPMFNSIICANGDLYILTTFVFALFSLATLTSLFKSRSAKQASNLYETLESIFSLPYQYMALLFMALCFTRMARLSLIYCMDLPSMSLMPYTCIIISLVVPTTILFRIVKQTVISYYSLVVSSSDLYCLHVWSGLYALFLLFMLNLVDRKHYSLSNIFSSKLSLVLLILMPIAWSIFTYILFNFEDKEETTNLTWNKYMTSKCICMMAGEYDERTFPESPPFIDNLYFDPSKLFLEQMILDEKQRLQGLGIPVSGPSSDGLTYWLGELWVRVTRDCFCKARYLSARFGAQSYNMSTASLKNTFENADLPNSPASNFKISPHLPPILLTVEPGPGSVTKTWPFCLGMFNHFFGVHNGFTFNHLPAGTHMRNHMVTYRGSPVLLMVASLYSKGTWLNLMHEAKTYLNSSDIRHVFVMLVLKGKVSFFIYHQDIHHQKSFGLVDIRYRDFLGLEYNRERIHVIQQHNTSHPQMRTFEVAVNADKKDDIGVNSILSYISNFKQGAPINDDFSLPAGEGEDKLVLHRTDGLGIHLVYMDRFGCFRQPTMNIA